MRSSKQCDKNILAMAKLVQYGTGWADSTAPGNYRIAVNETIAHIVACWLCQEYSRESEPTNDVLDELGLETCSGHETVDHWYAKLGKMVDRRKGLRGGQ